MADVHIDRDQRDDLLEMMLQVPGLDDSDVRDTRVAELTRALRRPLKAKRFLDSRLDLSSIISASASYTGGLRTLAQIVGQHHPAELSTTVVALAERLGGESLLSGPDRDTLCGHLVGVDVGQIADAVSELVDAADLRSLDVWRDFPTAIRMLESLPLPDDGVPQLLAFTDRLAHLVSGAKAEALGRWVDTVAGGLGVEPETLAELRAANSRNAASGRPSVVAPAQRSGSAEGRTPQPRRSEDTGIIWGGVPIRNRNFTGRVVLLRRLDEALRTSSKASVLPQTLQGMGGVGKTQLVIEYVYRKHNDYDLVWWIPAEQTATVLASLTQLAERLGLPTTEDLQQTARTALDALASSDLTWLLVYDNADDPAALDQFVPSTGGHVILTTRNQEFSRVGQAIEVDVFERHESIELLQRRSQDDRGSAPISTAEADELAEKLGDLPLALEQAAAWHLATAMPVNEYIELLDSHIKDLLSEGKPANYPLTVAAFVTLAVENLRDNAPATAQLFELFAFLGGEPTAMALLRRGKDADISEPLRTVLAAAIPMNRTVRDLSRFGLAKVDAAQRVQVHRLVQRVLRESLNEERSRQTLYNVQSLLNAANPGDPDDLADPERQRDMGPHLGPADMIHAFHVEARQAVLDHSRFLYVTGDYENSRVLARQAAEAWERDTSHPKLGMDGQFTLVARAQVANATRVLGDSARAAELARDAYNRMLANPDVGPRHDLTLITSNQIGADLRIEGKYREALDFDLESVALHREIFGPGDTYTLRAQANLAVDQRMIGDFASALQLDQDIADHWEYVGGNDPRAMAAYINLARNFYGIGAYRAGIEILEQWRTPLQESLGLAHSQVLLAGRTYAITLRKAGRVVEAAEIIRENQERVQVRFGRNHEFTVAAAVSYANVLRELGELDEALVQILGALERYDENFPPRHPLTLVARINEGILRRARSEHAEALALIDQGFRDLADVLGEDHPYTLCAGASLATCHAVLGEREAALRLSSDILNRSQNIAGGGHDAREGAEHPYVLMRAVNLSHDLRAMGEVEKAEALFEESIAGLRLALGPEHSEVHAIERGARTEGDIEPPPT